MPQPLENIAQESKRLHAEVRGKTVGYILAGFGFVAGLAWNDAIKAVIDRFIPAEGGGIIAKLIYAVIVTLVVVIIGSYLNRLLGSKEKEKE